MPDEFVDGFSASAVSSNLIASDERTSEIETEVGPMGNDSF